MSCAALQEPTQSLWYLPQLGHFPICSRLRNTRSFPKFQSILTVQSNSRGVPVLELDKPWVYVSPGNGTKDYSEEKGIKKKMGNSEAGLWLLLSSWTI
jgi:hypothetical protein